MDQQYHRQPLGCIVVLIRTYQSNHIEERVVFLSDRSQYSTPLTYFEEYLGVHPLTALKSDHEVLAYYPDQHPEDIIAHYGRHPRKGTTLFPYPYDNTPEGY
jgi:hypothetical protein